MLLLTCTRRFICGPQAAWNRNPISLNKSRIERINRFSFPTIQMVRWYTTSIHGKQAQEIAKFTSGDSPSEKESIRESISQKVEEMTRSIMKMNQMKLHISNLSNTASIECETEKLKQECAIVDKLSLEIYSLQSQLWAANE